MTGLAYYVFGILVSVIATQIHSQWMRGGIVVVGIVLAGSAYYFESVRRHRQVADETLEPLLNDVIFPMLRTDYERLVDDQIGRAHV